MISACVDLKKRNTLSLGAPSAYDLSPERWVVTFDKTRRERKRVEGNRLLASGFEYLMFGDATVIGSK